MEVPRKIGIGILMIVPTFVVSGALWDLFGGSWLPIVIWILVMAGLSGAIVTEKFSTKQIGVPADALYPTADLGSTSLKKTPDAQRITPMEKRVSSESLINP